MAKATSNWNICLNLNVNRLISLVNLSSFFCNRFVYITVQQHFSHTLMKYGLSVRNIGNFLLITEFLQETFLCFFPFTFLLLTYSHISIDGSLSLPSIRCCHSKKYLQIGTYCVVNFLLHYFWNIMATSGRSADRICEGLESPLNKGTFNFFNRSELFLVGLGKNFEYQIPQIR